MSIHTHVQQGTQEWHMLRLGIPTASEFSRIVTPAKLAYASGASTYIAELLAEWMSGEVDQGPSSHWMERGIEIEGEARSWLSLHRDYDVEPGGFVYQNAEKLLGCSPDGLVGADGTVEIKCPKPATHIRYLLAGGLPDEYRMQVQGTLWVTNRKWCDFLSYCPKLPPLLVRVEREAAVHTALSVGMARFIKELREGREHLLALGYEPYRQEAAA